MAQAVLAGERGDQLGDAGLGAVDFLRALQAFLTGKDDIEGAGLLDAAELERALHGDLFAADAEGNEGIVDLDAAEIKHIGTALGVGVEERGGGRETWQ